MAYEKYIEKDGKIYGPYIYHSRRVDGKVISEYHGQKKLEYRKFLWVIPFVLLILLGAYFIGQRDKGVTGYSVLDLNANYREGQALEGGLKLSLEEGELIPASSAVIFENAGKKYEYQLKDLISEPITEGNFFMRGTNISGSGEGFGVSGAKDIYPEVQFVLNVEEPDINDSNSFKIIEIEGKVSAEKSFTYILEEGQRAEIKLRSVKTDSAQLSEDSVYSTTEGTLVLVSTNYSEKEEGFGSSYSGKKIKELTINLNDLNLLLEKGELKVGIFYGGGEVVSMQTIVGDGTVSNESEVMTEETSTSEGTSTTDSVLDKEQVPKSTLNETFSEPATTTKIPLLNQISELTPEEKAVLEKEFGNISLEVEETKIKNGFMIMRYELREDTWINYSYSSDLDNNTLNLFMQQDRIKWLKDLAQKYSA